MSTHWSRSVIAKLSFFAALCALLMTAGQAAISYLQQKDQYYHELKQYQQMVHKSVEQHAGKFAPLKEFITKNKTADPSQPGIALVQPYMNLYTGSGGVANTYLLYPETKESGGKTTMTILLANKALADSGFLPSTPYELPPAFSKAIRSAESGEIGVSDVFSDDYGTWVSILSAIRDESGSITAILGIDFDYANVQQQLDAKLRTSLLVGVVTGAIAVAMMIAVIVWIIKPVRELARITQKVADGDLTESVSIRRKDEIGELAAYFGVMIGNIREMIGRIRETSDVVAENAETLHSGSEQTSEAARHVALSIEQVAAGTERQLTSSEESAKAMEEMAQGVQRIAESAVTAADSSNQAYLLAEQGSEQVHNNRRQMTAIQGAVSGASGAIERLGRLSDEIGSITSLISTIAGQTNLLALNAAIEAARAGEHGRGFAVVSGEIRKLAEQSRQAAVQIHDLVDSIQAGTREAIGTMQMGASEVEGMSETVEAVDRLFTSIVGSIEEVTRQIMEVSASSEQMSASSQEVSASIAELAHISKQSTEHTHQVAASSEEQLASMEEIVRSSTALQDTSQQLRSVIDKFKT